MIEPYQAIGLVPTMRGIRHRDEIGVNNIMVESDYPHADSHWPNAINHFMGVDVPSGARKKILWDNCARLYNVQ